MSFDRRFAIKSLILVLVALAGFALLWQFSSRRWKRWLILSTVGLGVCFAFLFGAPLAAEGLLRVLPVDSGAPVEAIVILGRGLELREPRVETATQLWQAKRAPAVFASGMRDAVEIVTELKAKGLPSQQLSGEFCSQTTRENTLYTAAILKPRGVQKILLVSNPPHLLRSFLEVRQQGFDVIPHSSPFPASFSLEQRARLVWREYLGLLVYAVTGRLQNTEPNELTEILEKLILWDCCTEG